MKRYVTAFFFSINATAVLANPYLVESAIYRVEVPYPDGKTIGFGTGVLVSPQKVLTNCHVLKAHPGWPRVVHRQTGRIFRVSKYYNLAEHDACVLVGGFVGTPVKLSTAVERGENVWIFGYPRGVPVVGQGAVDVYVRTLQGVSIQFTSFCDKGSSGGPVVNSKGELLGLNWGVFRGQHKCLAIPADTLRPFLEAS